MSAERVTRGFAWNHLYKIVEYGLTNLYTILVVRKFGPELAGGYAVYLSISGSLAIVCAFGVDGVLLRYLPRIARGESQIGSARIEGIRSFIGELFGFRMAVTLIVSLLVAITLGAVPSALPTFAQALGSLHYLWPFLILFLFGQATIAFSSFTLIGLLQVKWVFYASLIARLALLTAGLAVVLSSHLTLSAAVGIHASAAVLNGLLLLCWVHQKVYKHESVGLRKEAARFMSQVGRFVSKPAHFRLFIAMPFMLYGITTWGSDLLSTVLGRQPDILMMRVMLGENARDIGLYQSAAQLVLMTEYIFLFGLGGTLVSVFSELVHQDEETGPSERTRYPRLFQARRDVAGFQVVSTAPLFGFMLAFAPIVLQLLYSSKFADALPMVMVGLSILSITVIAFGGGMQVTSLVVIGKERLVFRNRLAWGILNLIGNFFMIRYFGGLGAMIGTQLANAGACMTESYFASRLIGSSTDIKRIAPILGIVAASVLLSSLICQLITVGLIVHVAIAGILSAGLTLTGYAVFRIPDARKVFDRVAAIFLKRRAVKLAANG